MKTVAQLRADILADIWPSGEPENLTTAHANHMQEALADISKWVDCEQNNQASVVRFCHTFYKMGMTVLAAPSGRIYRVSTIANNDFTDPVFYRQVPWPGPEAWARNLYLSPKPLITDAVKWPLGFLAADSTFDSLYGRARTGIWSIWKGNIYISPWIQSQEQVLIEWDGIKTIWADGDPVSLDIKYRQAVKEYMQFAHERDYGDMVRAEKFKNPQHMGLYDISLGDLIHECRERTRIRRDLPEYDSIERGRLCSELQDDVLIVDADGVMIADLGNVSVAGVDLANLTALVKSWGPDAIAACGFLSGSNTDYDATAGLSFFDFINPYIGNKGNPPERNGFYPVPSAADWTLDSLATFLKFFAAPAGHKYYDVVLGDVHLFVLDSSSTDPDGITSGGTQGAWLQGKLATSTAPWKVVKMELDAYGSVHSNATLQWPFGTWGANLLISSQAKNYERLSISGFPVINNGLGGLATIEKIATPTANTLFAYANGYGAGKITATTMQLLYQFYAEDGTLIDTLTLKK